MPMNLAGAGATVDYVNTGSWSKKAIGEAKALCAAASTSSPTRRLTEYTSVPPRGAVEASADGAAYLHYTPNETIGGVEFPFIPDAGDVPLVADFSSSILSRPLDVSRFGVIYAGAQKNIGRRAWSS
jgi:phosphoserine aminotransferase